MDPLSSPRSTYRRSRRCWPAANRAWTRCGELVEQFSGEGAGATTDVGRDAAANPALLHDPASVTFLPVIPDAEKFLCVGKNYRQHLEELRRTDLIKEMPEEPTGFIKLNACLTGHRARTSSGPSSVTRLDYEPELVFVIGRRMLPR